MTFLNPLNALIPKIPFSFFPDFWVWVTSEAQGSDSVGFWGSCQLSSIGVQPEGSIDPPPPKRKTRQPLCAGAKVVMRIMLKLQGSTPMFLSSTCFQITSCCKKRGGGGARALLHVDWRLDRQLALG